MLHFKQKSLCEQARTKNFSVGVKENVILKQKSLFSNLKKN